MTDLTQAEKDKFFYYQIMKLEGDYAGRIAYTLYKKNKIDYIVAYKIKNNGVKPTDEKLKEWQESECLDSKLKSYIKEAKNITNEFNKELRKTREVDLDKKTRLLETKEKDLKEKDKHLNKREKELNERNKYCQVKQKGANWVSLGLNLLASFIFLFLCWLIVKYYFGKQRRNI